MIRRLPGLLGQQLAPPLVLPRSLVATPLSGGNLYKRVNLARAAGTLDVTSESSTITTPWIDLLASDFRRDNEFMSSWTQLRGPPGAAITDGPLRARLQHSFSAYNSYPITWRCDVLDKYGRRDALQLDFVLAYTPPALPPLQATGYPGGSTLVPIDPVTRTATVYFSVSVDSGVPPYTFNWGGGDNPNSASNSATIYQPVGAERGIDFNPGCTITDAADRSIVVGAGHFFIYESL